MNIIDLFLKAGLFVQLIMLVLLIFSVISWAIIFQKGRMLRAAESQVKSFEDEFWSGAELSTLYQRVSQNKDDQIGSALIFHDGFREFARLHQLNPNNPQAALDGASRAMRLVMNRELDQLEMRIPFLGTVGMISPYIGLFGTVWGIMHAFIALGEAKQATLQMVAPGIAEALIATALGLFAAIPAVMAYNRLSNKLSRIEQHYLNFIDEFYVILHRQAFTTTEKK